MAKERKIAKTCTFNLSTIEEMEWLFDDNNPNKKFASFKDAHQKLLVIGLILAKQEGKIDTGELLEQMNGLIKDEKIMFWLQSLSLSQRDGLGQMIRMINEGQQTRL